MHEVTTPPFDAQPWYVEALPPELDRLVNLAWEPGWAPMMLGELVTLCRQLREGQDRQSWNDIRARLRAHDLNRLLREDPLVFHADKPAAVVQDLLVGHPDAAPLMRATTRAGMDLFAASRRFGWMGALAGRNEFLARMVDAVALDREHVEILTLGAGHLREAALVNTLPRLRRWVAVEPDDERRRVLRAGLPRGTTFQLPRCSLRGFARQPLGRGRFDLIAIPSLPEGEGWSMPALAALVASAFSVLKPGGRLVLCAPAATPAEAAWMETFLGWMPVWRSMREVETMLANVPAEECAEQRLFTSLDGRMHHAVLRRRG